MKIQPQQITADVQLLVEGKDAAGFFEWMSRHLQLNGLQIQNFGGVTELRVFLRAFVKRSDFSRVTRIGVVRDAEESAKSAFDSVRGALRDARLPVPETPGRLGGVNPGVSVWILPDANTNGMLETLLWETIPDDVRRCIDQFLVCIENVNGERVHRLHKARATAYLATQRKPHVSVGDAAKRSYWDLDHDALDPVRGFLRELAADA